MSGRGKGGKGLGKGGALVNFRAQAMEIIENLDEESDYGQLLSMEGDGGVADVVICYLEFEKNGDNKKFDEEMEMAHEIYGDDVFFPAVKYFDEHFDIDSKKVRNESDSGSEPKVVEEVVDSDSDSDSDSNSNSNALSARQRQRAMDLDSLYEHRYAADAGSVLWTSTIQRSRNAENVVNIFP